MKKIYALLFIAIMAVGAAYLSSKKTPKKEVNIEYPLSDMKTFISVDTLEDKGGYIRYEITSQYHEVNVYPDDSLGWWRHLPTCSNGSHKLTKEEGIKALSLMSPISSVRRLREFTDGVVFNIAFKDSSNHMVVVQGQESHPWPKHKGDWINWTRYPGYDGPVGYPAPFGHPKNQERTAGSKAILQFIRQFPDSAGTAKENKRVIRALEKHVKEIQKWKN